MPVVNRTPYRNLILTGHTGVGKTAVGREIVGRMDTEFYDLDNEITLKKGQPPEKIRELFGEMHLRSLEEEVISELSLIRSAVIAVNATTLLSSSNLDKLRSMGLIVCLTAALDEILRRLHVTQGARFHSPTTRSLLLGQLRRERPMLNLKLATIDTTNIPVETVVEKTIQFWTQQADI